MSILDSNIGINRNIKLLVLAAIAVLICAPYFSQAAQWIFINADEAKYSFGAHQFLSTGSWGYSGRKPGSALLVAVAALFLGNSPTTSLYAEGIVGLIMVLVVYKIARHYLQAPLAAVGSLALSSSLLFQYYTKTHIIFSSFFFTLGMLLYLQSIAAHNQSRILFLSGLCMGAGISCYYNLEIYIPALLLPEIALWRHTGKLQFRKRSLHFIGGAALIPLCLDLYAITYWVVLGRFSEPITMSLFDHLKLTNISGFNYPLDRFASLFVECEGKIVAALFLLGLFMLSRRILRDRAVKDVALLVMMAPLFLLQIRSSIGHLSVLRPFFSGFPFILLIALVPLDALHSTISDKLPLRYSKYLITSMLGALLLWCGWRGYSTFQILSRVSTGYEEVSRFLHQVDAERVAFWGNQFAWRYYFRDSGALELNTEGQVDTLNIGGHILEQNLASYQWVVINQARTSDLDWIEYNLSQAGFVFNRAFASNEFDFFLVRQEEFSDDYASYEVSKDIRIYENRTGS